MVEAFRVKDQPKTVADSGPLKIGDVPLDEPGRDVGLTGALTRKFHRLRHDVNTHHIPASFCQLDRETAGPAAKIECRATRAIKAAFYPLKQRPQLG